MLTRKQLEDNLQPVAAVMDALERGEETPPTSPLASLRFQAC